MQVVHTEPLFIKLKRKLPGDLGALGGDFIDTDRITGFSATSHTLTASFQYPAHSVVVAKGTATSHGQGARFAIVPNGAKTHLDHIRIDDRGFGFKVGNTISLNKNITNNVLGDDIVITLTADDLLPERDYGIWGEWEPLQIPNGAYHVQAPMKHRIVCKTARLTMHDAYVINPRLNNQVGDAHLLHQKLIKSWPYHTMYVEAQQARALTTAWDPATDGRSHPHRHSAVYSKKFAQMIFKPKAMRMKPEDTVRSAQPDYYEDADHDYTWECIREDDAFSFVLQLNDTNALQLRVADAEEHSLAQLADMSKHVSGWPEGAEVILEMACVYEQYTVPQEKPNHPHGAFMGYYKTAITDQHGV